MDLLADENVTTEWIRALRDDGHDVVRAVDDLGPGTADPDMLAAATQENRVLLTADQSDFTVPPFEDHGGIVIVSEATGGEVRRAVRRIERAYPDMSGSVAYVSDWR